jgi:hypothetical protein
MGYQLIETVTVGSGGAASIEFTSIPQNGVDLLLKVSGRDTGSGGEAGGVQIQFNNVTTSSYSWRRLTGNGSSAGSLSITGDAISIPFSSVGSSATASTFGNASALISNYTSSVAKSVSGDGVSENNATESYQAIVAGSWSGTDAISSIQIKPSSTNWAEHSTASLYKITAD